jgi:hypothetical protein
MTNINAKAILKEAETTAKVSSKEKIMKRNL